MKPKIIFLVNFVKRKLKHFGQKNNKILAIQVEISGKTKQNFWQQWGRFRADARKISGRIYKVSGKYNCKYRYMCQLFLHTATKICLATPKSKVILAELIIWLITHQLAVVTRYHFQIPSSGTGKESALTFSARALQIKQIKTEIY